MRKGLFLFLTLGFCLKLCFNAYSQEERQVKEEPQLQQAAGAPKTITLIKTKGNKVVSSATILSKIKTKPGDIFSQEQLNADLKRLFGLGFFTDISIETEDYEVGVAVTFAVVEKPLISHITFSGNKALRDEKLKKEMKSTENEMLDEAKLKADIERIKVMYKKMGYQLIEVTYKIEKDKDKAKNSVKVTITIDEKTRVKIRKITFKGNTSIPSKKLLKTISTRPDSLFTSGYFKDDTFQTDLEKLKTLYENAGFLDVRITHRIEYDRTDRWMNLAIIIEEGKKYIVGDIFIKGNVIFPEKEVRLKLKMANSTAFSQSGLRQDVQNIQQFYYQKGYMLAQTTSSTTLNPKTGRIDVTYNIAENEVVYIDKIHIKGNVKTRDVVIRRELRSYPGERFDGDKLRRSKERLYNLGYFEEVNFDTGPGSAPNKEDLIVTVKETKTGEFSFGGGFSSVERLIGFVSITQKNFDLFNPPTFTGDGQKLRVSGEFGSIVKNYELSWTEPWIFNLPLLFGFDLYERNRLRSTGLGYGYDERRKGGDLRLGKEFTDYLTGTAVFTMENIKIGDVSDDASADLKAEEGRNRLNSLLLSLIQDTRDNVFNPTKGYVLAGSVEEAGGPLGGTKDFMKYYANSNVYFTHFAFLTLELQGRCGITNAYGSTTKVPIYERFYAGGTNTIRGYRERRIGPKDPASSDPVGGEAVLIGNAEYTFPLYEKVLKGAIFYDIGNVWGKWDDIGTGNFKSGTGAGVRIKTPIGPVRLDFGYPLSNIHGERKIGRLHFTLSQGF